MEAQGTVIVDVNYCSKCDLNAESIRISCSGTVLDGSEELILTTGLIFGPLFQLKNGPQTHDSSECLKKLKTFFSSRDQVVLQRGNEFEKHLTQSTALLNFVENMCEINVLVESKNVERFTSQLPANEKVHVYKKDHHQSDINVIKNLFTFPKAILSSNATRREKNAKRYNVRNNNPDKVWFRANASVVAVWRCSALEKVLEGILNQNTGWTMTDGAKKSPNDEEQIRSLLPFFTLLKLNSSRMDSEAHVPPPRHQTSWKLLHRFDKTLGPYLMNVSLKSPTIGYGIDYINKFLNNWSYKTVKERPTDKNVASECLQPEMGIELNNNRQNHSLSTHIPHLQRLRDQLPEQLQIGSSLQIVSTPFGSLSPSVFLNSVSKGVVANLAGENTILIMTDARCVPGCEGGAITLSSRDHPLRQTNSIGQLVGVVIAPFCWRQNEWVGLTFGCTLRPLLSSLFDAINSNDSDDGRNLDLSLHSIIPTDCVSNAVDCVALIKVGSRWGSAVLVRLNGTNQRYLLTCRHVVQQECGSSVRARFTSHKNNKKCFFVDATVIYSTPTGQVYDIAILEIDSRYYSQLPSGIPFSTTIPIEGDSVNAIGHGLFDEHIHLPATITSGNLSKILSKNGKQVLIQSTCAVHPGASGGALVDAKNKQLIGIVVCNAKDAMCGASYPHINLSIPSTIIEPALRSYINNRDATSFNCLHDPDPILICYWQLGDNEIGQIHSKL